MSDPLRPDAVPGWVLDHVLGEADDHLLVAARRAVVLGAGEVAEYATLRVPHRPLAAPGVETPVPVSRPPATAGPPAPHADAPVPSAPSGRARVGALACAMGVVLLVVARPRAGAADVPPTFWWDTATATATRATPNGPIVFRVGVPGDQLVVGDWRGDGHPAPFLYRPSTGERWRFDVWATDEHDVAPQPLTPAAPGGTLRIGRVLGRDVPIVDVPTIHIPKSDRQTAATLRP